VRRAEWWVGGPHARESSFGLSVLHAVGLSVSVQHYNGVWPSTAVALRCGGVCPSASFFGGGLRSRVSLLASVRFVGGAAVLLLSFLSSFVCSTQPC
jgi:hypothetical protein